MTIDHNSRNYKTQICRKVTIGEETITLQKFGIQGATFTPIVYHVMRNHRGMYDRKEGEFKTKAAAVAFFKELTNFYSKS
jgi:hypothetical protein